MDANPWLAPAATAKPAVGDVEQAPLVSGGAFGAPAAAAPPPTRGAGLFGRFASSSQDAPAAPPPQQAQQPPQYGGGGGGGSLSEREEALRAREADLERRLADVQRREQEDKLSYNWPGVCGIKVTRHHIRDDIPLENRALIRMSYVCFLLLTLACFFNIIAGASILFGAGFHPLYMLLAIIWFIIVPSSALFTWHKTLYNVIINDSIVSWSSFWLFAWSNFGWSIWCSIGWYTTTNGLEIYGSGWFPAHAISKYVGNEGMYVIFTISAVLWTLEAAMAFALMFSARKLFKARGHSAKGVLAVGGTAAAGALTMRAVV